MVSLALNHRLISVTPPGSGRRQRLLKADGEKAPVRHGGINASPDTIFAKPPSSAPTGQPQISLGQSDPRERRPRLLNPPTPSALKGRNTGEASHCAALSGLGEQADSVPRALPALPWAGMLVPFQGEERSILGADAKCDCDSAFGDV